MVRKIVVCSAELVWSRENYSKMNEFRFYYVGGEGEGACWPAEKIELEDLAEDLAHGRLLSRPLASGDVIIYNPPVTLESGLINDYFGKLGEVVDTYRYEAFDIIKRAVLENGLERMGMKCQKLKDPDKVVVKKLKRIR